MEIGHFFKYRLRNNLKRDGYTFLLRTRKDIMPVKQSAQPSQQQIREEYIEVVKWAGQGWKGRSGLACKK
ncbi:hypothetical protein TorRG33x02_039460 [Trema orientale]|uniref:Uncharacterized protein n=1 Tax=Trema orientale TaxID=63057 RepID=A0A2P5FQU4_TREOI|nr:hypothetical protein TorRG33x02_039460 [Trema orientale]